MFLGVNKTVGLHIHRRETAQAYSPMREHGVEMS
jgi:hypothetical protein